MRPISILVAISMIGTVCAQSPMHDNKEAAIIDKILKCNTSKDAGDWYHSLFRSLSADALRELANHPSDTIACQAAWRSSSHRDRIVARDTLYWAEWSSIHFTCPAVVT